VKDDDAVIFVPYDSDSTHSMRRVVDAEAGAQALGLMR
jgi:hypothetical protein